VTTKRSPKALAGTLEFDRKTVFGDFKGTAWTDSGTITFGPGIVSTGTMKVPGTWTSTSSWTYIPWPPLLTTDQQRMIIEVIADQLVG